MPGDITFLSNTGWWFYNLTSVENPVGRGGTRGRHSGAASASLSQDSNNLDGAFLSSHTFFTRLDAEF